MGLFSKVLGVATLGLAGDSPFKKLRTGSTAAGKAADAAAAKAEGLGLQTLAEQQALKSEIGGIYKPTMQAGQQAFGDLVGFYGGGGYTPEQQADVDLLTELKAKQSLQPTQSTPMNEGFSGTSDMMRQMGGIIKDSTTENLLSQQIKALESKVAGYGQPSGGQQPIIDQAMQSPFMSQLVSQGENAIARNTQMTGGFRSGTTQENLAQNSQNVLMDLVNQVLAGKQGIANTGFGATDAYSTAAQNIIAGQGAARGQVANVDIANAAGKQNAAAGKTNMYGQIGSSLLGAGGVIAASDKRLKKNIVKVDEKHDLPWYTWDWNHAAKELGLTGSSEGHIAQEVQKVRPELVVERDGYLAINYGGF